MFSIVIPLYNKELSITNTLQSVLNQTFTEFEVVIVNDGSTDNSVEKVEAFNDPRIRLIHQANAGVSAARNKGIKETKFEWIAFLDADDLWMEDKLEFVRNAISSNDNIELVLHAFETTIVHRNKTIINCYRKEQGVLPSLLLAIVDGLKIQTSTVVVKKSLFENHKQLYFRLGVNNSEDREVWYKLACLKVKTVYLSNVLSEYVVDFNVQALTRNNNKKYHFLSVLERIDDFSSKLDEKERSIFEKYLNKYNNKQIANYWANLNSLPAEFRKHLSKTKYLILSKTISLPKILKKIINRSILQ